AQMFEDVEGEDAIESVVAKREGVRVTDDIGVSKNLAFEFDAIGIVTGGCAGSDVEDQALTPAKDGFELFSHRIAFMLLGNDLGRLGQAYRDALLVMK